MISLETIYGVLNGNNNQGLDPEAIAASISKDQDTVLPSEITNFVRNNPYHFLVSKNGLITLKHPTLR